MSNISTYLRSLRASILISGIILSSLIYMLVVTHYSLGISQTAKLVEYYGLVSLVFLYFSLLAGPFCYTFRSFHYRDQFMESRRALGVLAFYFGFLHSMISLFGQLGGFSGLSFLEGSYLLAIILGFIGLFIFSLLAITSFDYAVEKLSFAKWKLLHRFVYLAGITILIHTVMLGSHFSVLSDVIPHVTFIALTFLLLLEAPRFDKLFKRFISLPKISISQGIMAVILGILYVTIISPLISSPDGSISFDIHSAHKRLAQRALDKSSQNTIGNTDLGKIPGVNGDPTKRYTVSIASDPPNPEPNEDVTLYFTVYDASNGYQVKLFNTAYEKLMHFIIVSSNLSYFNHIHPTENDDGRFTITTQFPKDDLYHLYVEFQPLGGIEQQVAFTLPVGEVPETPVLSKDVPDIDKAKIFDSYSISVDTHGVLSASQMSRGEQTITFTFKDAKTGKPVTNLKPYLSSFGHLTMINEKTFDFIHVHPYTLTPPPPNATTGPTVDFLPIGIYGPFTPGIYKAFAEFNPGDKILTSDFTLEVK